MAPSMNELEAGAYRASLEALAHADPEKPILQPDAAPADVKEWLEARGVQNALALVDSAPARPRDRRPPERRPQETAGAHVLARSPRDPRNISREL